MRELVDPSKVRCSGPGLGSGVRAHVPQTFTVDNSKAGVAPLVVQLYGPTGKTLNTALIRLHFLSWTSQLKAFRVGFMRDAFKPEV